MPSVTGRESDKFMLRMPDGMRDRIKSAADENNRSMNAEIVATLEQAYPAPVSDQLMTAIHGTIDVLKILLSTHDTALINAGIEAANRNLEQIGLSDRWLFRSDGSSLVELTNSKIRHSTEELDINPKPENIAQRKRLKFAKSEPDPPEHSNAKPKFE